MAGLHRAQLLSFAIVIASVWSMCSWTDADTDDYVAKITVFSVLGLLMGLGLVVATSLPLCCGMMKGPAKIIAGVAISLGIFICFLPALGGMIVGAASVDAACDRCVGGCKGDDKKNLTDSMSGLGILVAYFNGMLGFVALILGIVAASLGCCICCKCCKMKDEEAAQGG